MIFKASLKFLKYICSPLSGFISCENKMLVRGQYFGEDALMEKNGVYFADAEVVEDAFLLAVSAEGFHCPQFSAVRASLEKGVKRKRRRRKRLLKALSKLLTHGHIVIN